MINGSIFFQLFKAAYKDNWEEQKKALGAEELIKTYKQDPKWFTGFVINWDESVLSRILSKLKKQYPGIRLASEVICKFDAIYCSGDDIFEGGFFPKQIYIVVEHENQRQTVRNELFKLLYTKAPLKVVIAYDLTDYEIAEFRLDIAEVNALRGCCDKEEFILINGCRHGEEIIFEYYDL